jgi:hypothetical protein
LVVFNDFRFPCFYSSRRTPKISGSGPRDKRKKEKEFPRRPLHFFVYARHGRGFMGWKSPAGEPSLRKQTKTASRWQGRLREEGSEGSRRQSCEPTNRNTIGGLVSGRAGTTRAKPSDLPDRRKSRGAQEGREREGSEAR